jgi:hypothetical protein
MRKPEIVVVLGRIYLHMIGKAREHEGKNRQRIRNLELGGSAGFLDIGFVGSEPRQVLGTAVCCGVASSGCSGRSREQKPGECTGQRVGQRVIPSGGHDGSCFEGWI